MAKKTYEKTCAVCGKTFTAGAPNAKYCSDACRKLAAKTRREQAAEKAAAPGTPAEETARAEKTARAAATAGPAGTAQEAAGKARAARAAEWVPEEAARRRDAVPGDTAADAAGTAGTGAECARAAGTEGTGTEGTEAGETGSAAAAGGADTEDTAREIRADGAGSSAAPEKAPEETAEPRERTVPKDRLIGFVKPTRAEAVRVREEAMREMNGRLAVCISFLAFGLAVCAVTVFARGCMTGAQTAAFLTAGGCISAASLAAGRLTAAYRKKFRTFRFRVMPCTACGTYAFEKDGRRHVLIRNGSGQRCGDPFTADCTGLGRDIDGKGFLLARCTVRGRQTFVLLPADGEEG